MSEQEIPVTTIVQSSCIFEICDLVVAVLVKDVAEGDLSGRLRDSAREALIKGTMIVDKDTEKVTRYPDHIIQASILLGEIKHGIRYLTNLTQDELNGICRELYTILPDDYDYLIGHIQIDPITDDVD